MNEPTVSIIINCFNGAQTLRRCLNSIFAQTFTDWEIIFWDNMSSDDSAAIAMSYGRKIKYFKSECTTKLSEARCNALEQCRGKYVAFLDVDDLWYPNKLAIQVQKIQNTDFLLCYGGISEVTPSMEFIRHVIPSYEDGNQFKDQLKQFEINMVTPLINLEALRKYGITFDTNIVASEEYNLFMRLALLGDFCSVDDILGEWVINQNSLTNQSIASWYKDRRYTLNVIISENPGIKSAYSKEFQLAYARSDYYEARFLISAQEWKKARKLLKKNRFYSGAFFFLWLFSTSPRLWHLLHNERLKRILSGSVLKKSKRTRVD